MEIKKLSERFAILDRIKECLIKTLGNNLLCAIAYGSTICEDFYIESDFDILLFLNNTDIFWIEKIKSIKENFLKESIKVDFNVHSFSEAPSVRKDCFWHNNRSFYFQKEINLYGHILFGENPFLHTEFSDKEMKVEAVKVINSLLYQSRKLLINKSMDQQSKVNLMKWCIYATLYALSFKGIFKKTKTEALEIFPKYYNNIIEKPIDFLKAKKENNVSDEMIVKAYKFLLQLDTIIFEEYKAIKDGI